jgi:WD40 repeat protein
MGIFSAKPKVLNETDTHFLIQGVANLKSQRSIAWVAKNEKNEYLREIAIEKLNPMKWKKLLIKIVKNQKETDNIKRRAYWKLAEYVNIVPDLNKLVEISEKGLGLGVRDKDICKVAKKRLGAINRKIKQTQKPGSNILSVQKDVPEKRELRVIWEQSIPESDIYKYVPVAFSKDGKILISGSGKKDKTIKLWNVADGKLLKTLKGHQAPINSLSVSPDGRTFASGSDDKTIKLWDFSSGEPLKTLKGHKSAVNTVTFSPGGNMISSCDKKNILLWDTSNGKILKNIKGDCTVIAVSPDGKTIASGTIDGIKLFDAASGASIKTLDTDRDSLVVMVSSIAFSPDSKIIALGGMSHRVVLWDLVDGKVLKKLMHKSKITSITFSRDGKTIASSATHYNISIRLWDTETKKLICMKKMKTVPLSVTFSPDGKLLGCGCKECIQLMQIK